MCLPQPHARPFGAWEPVENVAYEPPLTLGPCCLPLTSVLPSVLFQRLPVRLFLPYGVVPERVNVAQKVQATEWWWGEGSLRLRKRENSSSQGQGVNGQTKYLL